MPGEQATVPVNWARIEARQKANGCNEDNEPGDWGRPCCEGCLCADEAAGREGVLDRCRKEGLF